MNTHDSGVTSLDTSWEPSASPSWPCIGKTQWRVILVTCQERIVFVLASRIFKNIFGLIFPEFPLTGPKFPDFQLNSKYPCRRKFSSASGNPAMPDGLFSLSKPKRYRQFDVYGVCTLHDSDSYFLSHPIMGIPWKCTAILSIYLNWYRSPWKHPWALFTHRVCVNVCVKFCIESMATQTSGGSRISQRRGRELQGGANLLLLFGRFFPKTAWKWRNFGPLDPPLQTYTQRMVDKRQIQGVKL